MSRLNLLSGRTPQASEKVSLTILNQYFPPDFAATGQLIEELAQYITQQQIDVQVFTGQPSYAYNVEMAPAKEIKNNLTIYRTRVSKTRKYLGRTLSGLLYCARTFIHFLHPAHRTDLILLTTEPPFLLVIGYIMNRLFGIRYICLIYDLYPDAIVEFGFAKSSALIVRFWNRVNRIVWGRADAIIVLSESMKTRVLFNAPKVVNKISIIHNWSDPKWIIPIPKWANPFAEQHQLDDKFVVLYSGNMGRCHDLETIIEAAELLRTEPVKFVFIGAGPKRAEIEELARHKKLQNCLFLPYQEKSVLPHSLTACDLSLVSVGEGMEGVVAPSKFYSALAAGRPIVAICEKHSYLRKLIADANCGSAFQPGDSRGLAEFIRYLSQNEERKITMGQLGHDYIHERFTPEQIGKQYVHLVEEIVLKDTELRRALRGNEFLLLYQPFYSLINGQVEGFEVLTYWQHPQKGLIYPKDFIPLAEKTGLLVDIGEQLIARALQDLKDFQSKWDFPLSLKINLSEKQFYHPNLIPYLDHCLQHLQVSASSLCFDITEEILMSDGAAASAILLQLQSRGLKVCLEDFGEGATSVKFLTRFPVNCIDFDRKVINRLEFDPEADTLIEFINLLAKGKGIDVFADGIGSEHQLSRVQALGITTGKGHLFSKPISKEKIIGKVLGQEASQLYKAIQEKDTNSDQCFLDMPLVMLISEEPALQRLLKLMVTKDKLNFIHSNHHAGLEKIEKYQPNIILLDEKTTSIDLSEYCEFIRQLERDEGRDQTPILVFADFRHSNDHDNFSSLEAIDFISYPVNWELLRQQILRLIDIPTLDIDGSFTVESIV